MHCVEVRLKKKVVDLSPTLKMAALHKVEELIKLARKIYNREFKMPGVSFELTGTTAGKAYCGRDLISLNYVLFKENEKDFYEDTIPHEIAHLITWALYGRKAKAHGAEWKKVMLSIGASPSRCHNYDVSSVRKKKSGYNYVCKCNIVHTLTKARHTKIANGYSSVICKKCKSQLWLEGTAAPSVTRPSPTKVTRPSPTPYIPNKVPTRPTGTAPRLPTEPMLKYAKDLAKKYGVYLSPDVLKDFEKCRSFIAQLAGKR